MLRFDPEVAPTRESCSLPTCNFIARPELRVESIGVRQGSVSRYRCRPNEREPERMKRDARVLSQRAATVVCVLLGQIELELGAQNINAAGGQAVLVYGERPIRASVQTSNMEAIVITLPHVELSADTCRRLSATSLRRISWPFADYLGMLARSISLGSPDEVLSLYDATRALLLAVAKRADAVRDCGARTGAPRLLVRIETYINENLKDPDLSPGRVAAWFGISARYLHKLFSSRGETFGSYVLGRRLVRVSEDLSAEQHPRTAIAQIAERWGFGDISSFNRAFKARYGCTPTQFRNVGG